MTSPHSAATRAHVLSSSRRPMLTHLGRATAAAACITLCTFVPFLPGRYDGLAVDLSALAQVFGWAGLLLVPFGAAWLAYESTRWPSADRQSSSADKTYLFATAALVAVSAVWLFVSLAAAATSGFALGLVAFALWAYMVWRIAPRLKLLKRARTELSRALPVYLLLVPVTVALLQFALAVPATEFSRNRAIRNSARLIADIERYRTTYGHYPASLLSVWPDYQPWVIGIREYHYEPSGDAYNLFFEQPTFRLGTREFVMYNKLDQHAMTSHRMDRLHFTSAELDRRRGYYAVLDASHPHWKYFWFD